MMLQGRRNRIRIQRHNRVTLPTPIRIMGQRIPQIIIRGTMQGIMPAKELTAPRTILRMKMLRIKMQAPMTLLLLPMIRQSTDTSI